MFRCHNPSGEVGWGYRVLRVGRATENCCKPRKKCFLFHAIVECSLLDAPVILQLIRRDESTLPTIASAPPSPLHDQVGPARSSRRKATADREGVSPADLPKDCLAPRLSPTRPTSPFRLGCRPYPKEVWRCFELRGCRRRIHRFRRRRNRRLCR